MADRDKIKSREMEQSTEAVSKAVAKKILSAGDKKKSNITPVHMIDLRSKKAIQHQLRGH